MPSGELTALINLLRGPTLRNRIGLWLVPSTAFGDEGNQAARLGIEVVNASEARLAVLPEGTRYAGLTEARVIKLLNHICDQQNGGDCLLVYNFDLLLARLDDNDRVLVWSQLYDGFPYRRRALLIQMPVSAKHLLPSSQTLDHWRKGGRLVEKGG